VTILTIVVLAFFKILHKSCKAGAALKAKAQKLGA